MPLYEKYVGRSRDDFATLEDLQKNFRLEYDESFNFAYDCLDVLAAQTPGARAMLWLSKDKRERAFTFADMKRLSDKAANCLRAVGVKKGDRVMLVLKRHFQFWYALMALHKIGAVAVPATHLLTVKDYIYRLQSAEINVVIATGENDTPMKIDEAQRECPMLQIKLAVNGSAQTDWLDFDAGVDTAEEHWVRPSGSGATKVTDMMLLAFSSGTTGYPKMVWQDYSYPLGHIMTGCFWHRVEEGGLHFTISDTGWLKSLWGKLYGQWLGGSAVLTYDFDKFSAPDILTCISQYRVTTLCVPPTMYRYMIKEDLSQYDFSTLKHCTTAGEALNPEVYAQWQRQTGLKIFEGFGQSETTLCCMTLYPWMQPRLGSMGLPTPGYDLFVANENGNEAEFGMTGEICIRADETRKPVGLFGGYYKSGELTREVWHDGLYHTGDTAYRDEMGFLWYVGRIDDVIKSSGYRIGPFEVESAMMEHPAVLEVAVTGIPDPDRGMLVKATVVLTNGYNPSDELTKELQELVKKTTAPYKYPRVVAYVDVLPKTISGKIRRREIREQDAGK